MLYNGILSKRLSANINVLKFSNLTCFLCWQQPSFVDDILEILEDILLFSEMKLSQLSGEA